MPSRLARYRLPIVVCALLFVDSPFAAAAQRPAPAAEQPAAARPAPQVVLNEQDSRETRNDFEALLKRFPPSVGRVMRIDPSLMRNEAYLAPYPTIAAFLQQHPDVVQNPELLSRARRIRDVEPASARRRARWRRCGPSRT